MAFSLDKLEDFAHPPHPAPSALGLSRHTVTSILHFPPCVLSCSVVSRLFATPWTVAHQGPLSLGILQARILEWVAVAFPRGSSQPRDRTQVSHTAGGFLTVRAIREAPP